MANLNAATLFNVRDMIFVITGAGSGIGAMMAKALAQNGAAKVYILGRRIERLRDTAATHPDIIIPLQCDVSSQQDLGDAAAKVAAESGFVNAVIANSGTGGPSLTELPANASLEQFQEFLWNVPMGDINDVFALNTTAAFYTCVAFLKLLHKGNTSEDSPGFKNGIKSQFIATGSIAAFNRKATAGFAYGASKAALTHLIKMLAHYLATYMIRTNVIAPGLYASEMTAHLFGEKDPTAEGFMSGEVVPLKRYGSEEDMAGAILYLCSRAGAYVDGNILLTDGGRLSMMPATY